MPSFLSVKNNASSVLAADITDVATSLTVAAGEGARFPASNFHITIEDEILKCSTRTGDVLTVTRAQESTAAAAHAAAKAVRLNITATIISELQTAINDHILAVTGVHSFNKSCGISRTTAQAIANATDTEVIFEVEGWDTDGMFTIGTNASRIYCKTAGLFLVTAFLPFVENATGFRIGFISKNGTVVGRFDCGMDTANRWKVTISVVVNLVVDDYVNARVYQSSGAALNLGLAGDYLPNLTATRLV